MSARPEPDAGKAAWRRWARSEWSAVDRAALSPRVVDHLGASRLVTGARTILLYYPMAAELDVTPLIARLDPSVVVTATRTPPSGPLTLHRVDDGALEIHRFGFPQPTAGAAAADPRQVDVALIPGLSFARDGTRLGHGAGYFDELLSRLRPDAVLVGVVPHRLVAPALPRRSHDVPMTHLVTERALAPVG